MVLYIVTWLFVVDINPTRATNYMEKEEEGEEGGGEEEEEEENKKKKNENAEGRDSGSSNIYIYIHSGR